MMKRFEKKLQYFFELSNAQLRALRLLLFITILSFLIPNIYSAYFSKSLPSKPIVAPDSLKTNDKTSLELTSFNPNLVDSSFLAELKLPDYVIKNWLKDISYKKEFKEPIDVLKIYGLNKKDFLRIEPYLIFTTETKNITQALSPQQKKHSIPQKKKKQEINNADYRGIIRVLNDKKITSRTLNFRNKLGGFYNELQYAEIYEINQKQIRLLKQNFYIEPNLITKINLDTSSFKTVLKHPYLGYEDVKTIFRLHQINNLNKTTLSELLTNEKYERVSPYLLE